MNKDSLEHLSSLMDGELSHETSLFVAKRMGSDAALGKTWSRYHLVRECLRRPGGKWALTGLTLNLDGIEANVTPTRPQMTGGPRWIRAVSGFAIAASVAVVSIMVALPPTVAEKTEPATANQPFTSPNPLAAVPVSQPASYSGSARAGNQRLNTYLIRHNQVAGAAGRQGFVSFMPIVTAAPVQPMDAAETSEDKAAVESAAEQTTFPEAMMRVHGKLLWALVLCLAATTVAADNYAEARRYLERMAESMDSLTYQGTFVYVRGEDVETMRVTHVNDGNGKRERMYAVSGPPREIIRDQDGVRCALGDKAGAPGDPVLSGSLFPEIPVEELAEAGRRYWFKLGGETRIAGHRGTRLSILPRDEYRYGYDLWLEKDSGLLLRWVLYDANRRALAKLMFTDLTIGEGVDLDELEPATSRDRFVRMENPATHRSMDSEPVGGGKPDGIPPGFTLAARSMGPEGGVTGLQHFVFSDGLASVSVYIEQLGKAAGMRDGLSRLGTTNAYSMSAGNRKVTSIGEVPPITVKTMTNAFAAPLMAAD